MRLGGTPDRLLPPGLGLASGRLLAQGLGLQVRHQLALSLGLLTRCRLALSRLDFATLSRLELLGGFSQGCQVSLRLGGAADRLLALNLSLALGGLLV